VRTHNRFLGDLGDRAVAGLALTLMVGQIALGGRLLVIGPARSMVRNYPLRVRWARSSRVDARSTDAVRRAIGRSVCTRDPRGWFGTTEGNRYD